jgi:hypothetical protein
MKIVKLLMISSMLLLLPACSFDINKNDVDKVKEVFSEQLDNLYYLYENNVKDILKDFSLEKAENMLNDILASIPEDKKELVYKGIEKGITLVEDGKEILANELSIDISVEGVKEEIEKVLESLSNIDARISVGDVIIEKTKDNYKLDCTINFFYENKN